ncbi:hypothetical protein FRY98_18940 [Paenibacillus faecis]|uniref:Uncharacterized protein n=1 Tax=Paenibacillus faecis TaxID=862114 RepID=A0A5D0CMW3_9BACL|nr:hypothetical protein [Paenibacillus faecis]TYA11246.1 hypothetical protein FRY98_18940 [Paenibacillus faecis]
MRVNEEIIYKKIDGLRRIKNPELIRFELFSILTSLLLSKNEFKNNTEIVSFLSSLNIEFKEYVFKSRTLILARVLRTVENLDESALELYTNILENMLKRKIEKFEEEKSKEIKQQTDKSRSINYFEEILKKYSRNRD